jgi:hypothetical protein
MCSEAGTCKWEHSLREDRLLQAAQSVQTPETGNLLAFFRPGKKTFCYPTNGIAGEKSRAQPTKPTTEFFGAHKRLP